MNTTRPGASGSAHIEFTCVKSAFVPTPFALPPTVPVAPPPVKRVTVPSFTLTRNTDIAFAVAPRSNDDVCASHARCDQPTLACAVIATDVVSVLTLYVAIFITRIVTVPVGENSVTKQRPAPLHAIPDGFANVAAFAVRGPSLLPAHPLPTPGVATSFMTRKIRVADGLPTATYVTRAEASKATPAGDESAKTSGNELTDAGCAYASRGMHM